ncbi:MAG: fatty acid desaturase [Verrucomicrobiota bacterium JB023]|nr:fatty acid desaturase [Verrucomicrobiota bacterium JB023]
MPLRIPFARVNWVNTVFLSVITLLALVASPIYLWHHGINWFQAGMMLFYIIATGMSITLGYHRLFSHLSFKAKWPVRLFTLVFGSCAFENSALNWCSDHRRHHKHTDHDDDPYNISNGFFWAHIGWILFKVNPEPPLDNVADLRKDKMVMWQHKWDKVIALVVGFLLPAGLGYLHSGPVGALGGFLLAGVLRVFLVQQCTFFINSLCHTVGRQPYSTRCSARDSFLMSLFTFGEGYHNYHHEFQHDYRNGVKPWNFDPTKWAIWLLEKVGLASNLRRVPSSRVVLAEIRVARKKAEATLAKISNHHDHAWRESAERMAHELMERFSESCSEMEKALSDSVTHSKQAVETWRKEAREIIADLGRLRRRRMPLTV